MEKPTPGHPVVIDIPKPTPDQAAYLEDIVESQEMSDLVVMHCICPIGGPRGPHVENDPPCPIHGKEKFGPTQFDPASPVAHIQNKRAAKERGWRYDQKYRCYRDMGGSHIADRFGQLY